VHGRRGRLLALILACAGVISACEGVAGWRDEVSAICDRFESGIEAIPEPDGTLAGVAAYVDALQALGPVAPVVAAIEVPADVRTARDQIVTLAAAADASLQTASVSWTAGNGDGARAAVDSYIDGLIQARTAWALAGVRCGDADPAEVAAAQRNVPLEQNPWQLATGFGSVWVSERFGHRVVRVDPGTGVVAATIDVGADPFTLQPADGRMWVRTADRYVAVDPATNTIVATVTKADVGAAADRNWTVDGALWICDGQRLHRYDPTTAQPVAVLDLSVDCGQVYATPSLVIAWSYNEADGESGTSAAAIVDPATNKVVARVDLPVDVGVPVVLDHAVVFAGYGGSRPVRIPVVRHAVFFPGAGGSRAVVVDPTTWTVAAVPDLGRAMSGSLIVTDGRCIYIPEADGVDVLVVDASTYTVTATIHTLGSNAVAVDAGALWAVGDDDLLQGFSVTRWQQAPNG
jgi:hypothetical protein